MSQLRNLSAAAATAIMMSFNVAAAEPNEAETSFVEACTAAMKGPLRPEIMVKRVCACVGEKTRDEPKLPLRAELLEVAAMPRGEQDDVMSEALKEVRKECRPI